MMPPRTRLSARLFRGATLVFAPLVGMLACELDDRDVFLRVAGPLLFGLWLTMLITVLSCAVIAPLAERRGSWIERSLDVLTATGAAVMWTGAAQLVLATYAGWASLSLLGTLGLGTVQVVAIRTVISAGGRRPWRDATIQRTISPEVSVEGDSLREHIRLSGVHIPAGMRLFISGWTSLHGVVTRYAVGAEAGKSDVRLESDLGPALRGEHCAPALSLWLADTLGLTRTAIEYRGRATFTVLPRPGVVDGARGLLGAGGDDAQSQQTPHQPTEGTFRIREYAPGDDTRRIHWVRSLQADKLIMRLPDEVPPADPALRLVIDSELDPTYRYLCRAPSQLLDAVVHVWLGIGSALTASGTRVTLVAAAARSEHDDEVAAIERVMHGRTPREALRLGARIAWQNRLSLESLLARSSVRQVVVSARPRPVTQAGVIEPLWIVVPESAWTSPETWLPTALPATLPFPIGAAENRLGRRRRERKRLELAYGDRALFRDALNPGWIPVPGTYVARPDKGRVALAVI